MPRLIIRSLLLSLCCATLFSLACTEAKRLFDDKPDAKAKASPVKTETASPSVSLEASPSPKAATTAAVFSGDIAGKAGKRLLYQLLEKNNKKTVKLDFLLSDEQLGQLKDLDGKWYFDLAYEDKDGFNTGGEMLIDIAKGKGDLKLNGNHLTGNITVTGISGPHQGLMSISAKPASADTASARKETAPPQAEGKKK